MHMQRGSNEAGGGDQSSTPQWGPPCGTERGGEVLRGGGSVANPIAMFVPIDRSSKDLHPTAGGGETPREQL